MSLLVCMRKPPAMVLFCCYDNSFSASSLSCCQVTISGSTCLECTLSCQQFELFCTVVTLSHQSLGCSTLWNFSGHFESPVRSPGMLRLFIILVISLLPVDLYKYCFKFLLLLISKLDAGKAGRQCHVLYKGNLEMNVT